MTTKEPLFAARGPVSEALLRVLPQHPDAAAEAAAELPGLVAGALRATDDIVRDDDLQLSLLMLQCTHYGGLLDADDAWEWHPDMVACRAAVEDAFEQRLRRDVPVPDLPDPTPEGVAQALFAMTAPTPGPSSARFLAREAGVEQLREFLVLRSVYTLKEADAQTLGIARLQGSPKAALIEIQIDEYGSGDAERMHSSLFAKAMRSVGLDDRYGAHLDHVPAVTIASFTMMTMFGMHRRLRGALAGHFAAYEMTSSAPSRLVAQGIRRLGLGEEVAHYFDEHVEADAVHEQIAGRDYAGGLAQQHPELVADIMWGANTSAVVDGWGADAARRAWEQGSSALRMPLLPRETDGLAAPRPLHAVRAAS